MQLDDETLMAYADGELSPAEAESVEKAMDADPEVARRVERFRSVRRALKTAYDSVANEPIPDRLRALLHDVEVREPPRPAPQAKVVDIAAARARRFSTTTLAALAACVVAGVLIGRVSAPQPLFVADEGHWRAGAELTRVLDRRIASAENNTDADLRVGFSIRTTDGFCRTFNSDRGAVSGLACRDPEGWAVRVAEASPPDPNGVYRQASAAAPAVLEMVDEMIVGEPLEAAQEEEARANDWRVSE